MDEPAVHVPCDDPETGLSTGGAPGEEPDVRALGFEALSMSAAILDADGTIRAANMSWRLFSCLNGGPETGAWVGTSYFDPCRAAVARGDAEAADAELAMQGIRAVCEGRRDVFEMEYPCPSPDEERWFLLRASPLPGRNAGAVVSHLDVTRRKRLEQRLEHSASHDPLTGFPNRRLLHDRLSVALARRRGDAGAVAVLFCDLDGFKAVNDTLGHADGDDLLSMAAARLEGAVRSGDSLGRVGGDEFAVVCDPADSLDPGDLAARIEAAFAAPFQLGTHSVQVGISVGWAVGRPGEDPRAVLAAADRHMYERKAAKRGAPR
jgi:diguanylate cyclase (GGDEF)-like protein